MASNITINTSALGVAWQLNTTYRVEVEEDFVRQESGLKLPIAGGVVSSFTTNANPPTISSTDPVNGAAASEENSLIRINFDRPKMVANVGNVQVYRVASPNVLIGTYSISSNTTIQANTASVIGNSIQVPVNHLLAPNTSYFVRTAANIARDEDGFNFAGITSNTTVRWTTSSSWQKDLTVPRTQTYNEDTAFVLTGAASIVADINNLIDYENGNHVYTVTINNPESVKTITAEGTGGNVSWTSPNLVIQGTASEVNGRISNITITPADDYTGNISVGYTLVTPQANTYTRSQVITLAQANNEVSNLLTARTFAYAFSTRPLFIANPTQIDDSGVGSDDIYTIRLTMDDPVGTFSATGYPVNGNLNLVGNKTTVNSLLANVQLVTPNRFVGNLTYTYTQIRNGIEQIAPTRVALTQTGAPNTIPATSIVYKTETTYANLYYITNSATLTVNNSLPMQYAIIGGGGGAFGSYTGESGVQSPGMNSGTIGAGGAGAGGVIIANAAIASGTYTVSIGAGGAIGSNGDNTNAFGYTAVGGGRGAYGGENIIVQNGPGILISQVVAGSGGSGGGGVNYNVQSYPNANPNVRISGTGIGGQGFSGANVLLGSISGGGGAGGPGTVGSPNFYGDGGPGVLFFGQWVAGGGAGQASDNVIFQGTPGIGHDSFGGGASAGKGESTIELGGRRYFGLPGKKGAVILAVYKDEALPTTPIIGNVVVASNVAGNVSATINYTPSTATLGNIISHTVVAQPGGLTATTNNASATSITIGSLLFGTNYTFSMHSNSDVARSLDSNTANLTIFGAPNAPVIGTVTATSNVSVSVGYTASTSNGGNVITSYTAISTPGNVIGTLSTSTSGIISVTGLTPGQAYTFRVYATNFYGVSPLSSASASVTTPTVPGAPTINDVTLLTNSNVRVRYTAPVSNGGNAIISHSVISTPGNVIGTTNTAGNGTIRVDGLAADTYNFKAYATNYWGNSAESAASSNIAVVNLTSTDSGFDTVELLINGGGTNGNASIIDSSHNNYTPITLGPVYSNTTWKYSGSTSLRFNGTSNRLRYPNTPYLNNFGTENFTIEYWARPDSGSIGHFGYELQNMYLLQQSNTCTFSFKETNYVFDKNMVFTWEHWAIVRYNNTLRVYVNGTAQTLYGGQLANSTISLPANTTFNPGFSLTIGDLGSSNGNFFKGHMEGFRISRGIARYAANFTPPSAAFPKAV
jgi:hypothetical protein